MIKDHIYIYIYIYISYFILNIHTQNSMYSLIPLCIPDSYRYLFVGMLCVRWIPESPAKLSPRNLFSAQHPLVRRIPLLTEQGDKTSQIYGFIYYGNLWQFRFRCEAAISIAALNLLRIFLFVDLQENEDTGYHCKNIRMTFGHSWF